MNIRARKNSAPLRTKVYKQQIIGGNTNYCADMCGYVYTERGLVPSFSPVPTPSGAKLLNVHFAEYSPECGYSIVISKFGNLIKWNTTDLVTVKTAGVVSRFYPFGFHCYNAEGACVYALVTGAKVTYFTAEKHVANTYAYTVIGGAYHYGRVFAIDNTNRYLIRWSGTASPHDYVESADGAGSVSLNPRGGKCLNVVPLGEKLLIVRQNAITVMRVYGDPRNFRVEPTENYLSLPDVKENTSVICGGQLYFCTVDGLYVFNGAKAEKIKLPDFADGAVFESAKCYDGAKIYLKYTRGDRSFFAEYDADKKTFSPFAPDCEIIWQAEGGLMCLKQSFVQHLVKDAEDDGRFWRSKKLGDGAKSKTLKRLYIRGAENIKITVEHEGQTSTYSGNGWHTVMERGREFTFTVGGAGELSELVAEWEENA